MNNKLSMYVAKNDITIVSAMQMIDKNVKGIVYITDEDNHLVGSLTDGDIRRWIIKTGDLTAPAENAMNKKPYFSLIGDSRESIEKIKKLGINSLPIVNENREIMDIIFMDETDKINSVDKKNKVLKNVPVIIMAGGKGTRLYPYTKILPKPLIPIGETPIIERIADRFHKYGADNFYISVNYKKEMIKSYFTELNPDYSVTYIEETKPLGTAGSIKLINENFDNSIIVTNCDTIIEVDYSKALEYHKKSQNLITMVSALKNTVIPYGVVKTKEEGIVSSIEEKPTMSYLINTGMYIVEPECIDIIPDNTFFHMTNLVENLLETGKKVGMFPVSEDSFLDMGEFEEMKKMEERLGKG